MRSKAACVSVLVRFVIFSMAVSGCGEVETASVSEVAVGHENLPLKNIQVVNLNCRQDGEDLVISGRVRRSCNFCYEDVEGHVDIAVVDSEGLVLGTTSTFYYPPSIPKRGARYSSFSTRLAMRLPKGAIVRTAYHETGESAGSAHGDSTFQCRNNMAAQEIKAADIVKRDKDVGSSRSVFSFEAD